MHLAGAAAVEAPSSAPAVRINYAPKQTFLDSIQLGVGGVLLARRLTSPAACAQLACGVGGTF
jgi:hypothetical protein